MTSISKGTKTANVSSIYLPDSFIRTGCCYKIRINYHKLRAAADSPHFDIFDVIQLGIKNMATNNLIKTI